MECGLSSAGVQTHDVRVVDLHTHASADADASVLVPVFGRIYVCGERRLGGLRDTPSVKHLPLPATIPHTTTARPAAPSQIRTRTREGMRLA
jgi:hypothetical protein